MKTTVQRVALRDLVAAPKNTNAMTEDKQAGLTRAMQMLGPDLQPILVSPLPNGQMEIVDGHHRVDAAKKAGHDTILAVVKDRWDENERAMVAMGMNHNRGELDLGAAADVVSTLLGEGVQRTTLIDLTGFTEGELAALLHAAAPEPEDPINPALEPDGTEPADPKPFLLELTFATREDLQKVKKALKRAGGKSGSLEDGLLKILDAS